MADSKQKILNNTSGNVLVYWMHYLWNADSDLIERIMLHIMVVVVMMVNVMANKAEVFVM